MGLSRSLLSAASICEYCHKETRFLALHSAIALSGVSRSTMYYWMEHRWIHWRETPSGRRLICEASLSRPVPDTVEVLPPLGKNSPKLSDNVRNRPIR